MLNILNLKLRYCLLLFLLFFAIFQANADDSLTLVRAPWHVKKIATGVRLHSFSFTEKSLFGANENISFVEVKRGLFSPKFRIAADTKKLIKTSTFAEDNNAIAAINGNFFNMRDGGSVDFTKVDGAVVNTTTKGQNRLRNFHQKAAVVIERKRPAIIKWDGFDNWEEGISEPFVLLNGPLLMLNGIDEKLADSLSFNTARHPRTCLGIKPNGRIIMLVVDGRSENSAGMSLFELAKVMRWLGCVTAINFDGGGSTTLWTRDKGVVNHPSDNGKWDHNGERKVANVLMIKRGR